MDLDAPACAADCRAAEAGPDLVGAVDAVGRLALALVPDRVAVALRGAALDIDA